MADSKIVTDSRRGFVLGVLTTLGLLLGVVVGLLVFLPQVRENLVISFTHPGLVNATYESFKQAAKDYKTDVDKIVKPEDRVLNNLSRGF